MMDKIEIGEVNMRMPAGVAVMAAVPNACASPAGSRNDDAVRRLHELEKKYLRMDAAGIMSYSDLRKEMENEARKLLHLIVDERVCRASAVYFCTLVKDGFMCPGPFADDTIRLIEFPEMVNLVLFDGGDGGSRLALRSRPGYLDEMPVLFTGDPGEMHSTGYDSVERIHPADDGSFTLELKDPSSPQVLFTIVKGKGDFLYKKYVWVVKEG
jgi:hypothetical protein